MEEIDGDGGNAGGHRFGLFVFGEWAPSVGMFAREYGKTWRRR